MAKTSTQVVLMTYFNIYFHSTVFLRLWQQVYRALKVSQSNVWWEIQREHTDWTYPFKKTKQKTCPCLSQLSGPVVIHLQFISKVSPEHKHLTLQRHACRDYIMSVKKNTENPFSPKQRCWKPACNVSVQPPETQPAQKLTLIHTICQISHLLARVIENLSVFT